MGTTSNYALPYPAATDPPDGATQIQALATAVDTNLKTVDNKVVAIPKIQAGQVSVTPGGTAINFFSGSGQYYRGTATVTFATAFSATPAITVSAATSVPGTFLEASVSGASATGFTINVARVDTTSQPVYWIAVSQTQ